jgi:ParB family chromosome partitioning protein
MAGLQTIPAVVQRRNYDEVTRFVRQLVENIQREDLNDVDRAAGLLRLRDLLQEQLAAAKSENISADEPWASKMTWAKVGKRLGYTRQRIHQLIQLLKLPDEIKEAVREGSLSERDTRIYQGLKVSQQRALHEMRMSGALNPAEAARVARYLKEAPEQTVHQAVRHLRRPPEPITEPQFDDLSGFDNSATAHTQAAATTGNRQESLHATGWAEGTILPLRNNQPTGIDRLHWIRGHLSRIQRHGLSASERQETLRLLRLIQQDVASLIAALESDQT